MEEWKDTRMDLWVHIFETNGIFETDGNQSLHLLHHLLPRPPPPPPKPTPSAPLSLQSIPHSPTNPSARALWFLPPHQRVRQVQQPRDRRPARGGGGAGPGGPSGEEHGDGFGAAAHGADVRTGRPPANRERVGNEREMSGGRERVEIEHLRIERGNRMGNARRPQGRGG